MNETPIVARTLLLAAALVASPAAAQDAWSEDDVLALARERSVEALASLLSASRAEAEAETAGLWPNPALEWERQEAFAPNAQTQDIVRLVVPLELSGRPAARRALADVTARVAEADAHRARLDAMAAALDAFYRALALDRRAALQRQQQAALEAALEVMESRREAGETSGYETARLRVALELARSAAIEAEVHAAAARRALAAAIGVDDSHAL